MQLNQFHKQLQLVGEAHEEEIAELHSKHTAQLWAAEEEIKRLREQVVFLEAVLPREYKGRAPLPDVAKSEISSEFLPLRTPVEIPCKFSNQTVTISTDDKPVLPQGGPVGILKMALSTGDIQLEKLDQDTALDSTSSDGANDHVPSDREYTDETLPEPRDSLGSDNSLRRHSSADSVDEFLEEYVHQSDRAQSNWFTIGKLILMANSIGAARLHPAWHKSVSQLKTHLESKSSIRQSIAPDLFSGIAHGSNSGRKEDEVLRFVRLSRMNSIIEKEAHNARKRKTCKCRLILTPTSKRRIFWDSCSAAWCANDFVMFPLQFVDTLDFGNFENTRTWVATIFWTLDIFVSMSTGFYTEDGGVELSRLKILKHYMKSWFLFDVLVLTPDWISCLLSTYSFRMGLGILKFTRVLRMVRLMRAVRLLPKLWESIGQHNSERVVTLARLLQHIIMMILINHYVACFLLATWLDIESGENFSHTYLRCLHWALAHSTLGNMDIFPKTLFERLWTCLMLMLSMILFSYFLSNITNAVMHLGSLTGERRKQETRMRQFFNENKVSRQLAGQVWNYVWRYHDLESHTRLSDVKLFNVLPNRMRIELYYQIFLPYVLVHPLFAWYNQMEPEALVMLCSVGIEQAYLHPSEEFLLPHYLVKKMIFVNSGSLLYQPSWESSANAIEIQCHMWVCEEALWSHNAKIGGTISAGLSGSDLMLVVPEQFRLMASRYTKSMPFLVSYAQTFISRFNAACADEDFEDLLFNSSDMIETFIHIAKVDYGHRFSTNTKRNIFTKAFNLSNNTRASHKWTQIWHHARPSNRGQTSRVTFASHEVTCKS